MANEECHMNIRSDYETSFCPELNWWGTNLRDNERKYFFEVFKFVIHASFIPYLYYVNNVSTCFAV